VTAIGVEPLEYQKDNLADAAHLAHKMSDQGVQNVQVHDDSGRELSQAELDNAPLPAGWEKRNDA
jgi:hypothetical protein